MLQFVSPWVLILIPIASWIIIWGRRVSYVNQNATRRRLSLALRLALVNVLVIALATPMVRTRASSAPLVLLVDVSRSITDKMLAREKRLVEAVWQGRAATPVEVMTFAGHPRRAAIVDGHPVIERHDMEETDLAEAIIFARGLFPDRPPRMVVFSDGHSTRNQVELRGILEEATAAGSEIHFVSPEYSPVDARVKALHFPEVLRRQDPTRLGVVIESTQGGPATVGVQENELLVEKTSVVLKPGSQEIDLSFEPRLTGLVRYAAEVKLDGDEVQENDRFEQRTWVNGPPRVLLVSASPEEGEHLEEALIAQDISVELAEASSLPSGIEGLLGYDEVILVGLAPHEIDRLKQSALASYVRDSGGGLIFVSGPRGLRRDPEGGTHTLDGVLPTELATPSERQEPPVAMVLLVDQSGSMVGEKLNYAKQAALAVIDRLNAHDQIGVIAFDANFNWVIPFSPLDDKARVKAAIGALGAGGGTRFYPALEEAYFTLGSAEAAVRHVILLTDGDSTDPNIFPALLEKARAASITVSTVAIGHKADVKLLGEIAKLGGGRFTQAANASQVPNIFVKETETVQRDAAQRSLTTVRVGTLARELSGIDFTKAPPLKGYLRTRAKAGAEVLLESDRRDPILARWRYGLGTVAVFTSDATTAWSELWLTQRWSGFGKLWAQLARGVQRQRSRHDLTLTMKPHSGQLLLDVEAIDPTGRFIDDLDVRVHLVEEKGARDVTLEPVGPGHYRATSVDLGESLWAKPVAARAGRRFEGDFTVLARPYSPELLRIGVDEAEQVLLQKWGKGQRLVGAKSVLTAAEAPLVGTISLVMPLSLLALLLFLADLAAKRMRWEVRP